jgi:hypothetical protein
MPYASRKVPRKNCWKVYNKKTKKVFAKCTSSENAQKQMNLLRAIENNKNFVPNSKRNKNARKTRKRNFFLK